MLHFYFYTSSDSSDKCSPITIITTNAKRAFCLAVLNFRKHRYNGSPVRIAI